MLNLLFDVKTRSSRLISRTFLDEENGVDPVLGKMEGDEVFALLEASDLFPARRSSDSLASCSAW